MQGSNLGEANSLPAPPLSDTLRVLIDASEGHMLQTNSPWCQGEAPQIKMSVRCKEQACYPVEVRGLDWMPISLVVLRRSPNPNFFKK